MRPETRKETGRGSSGVCECFPGVPRGGRGV